MADENNTVEPTEEAEESQQPEEHPETEASSAESSESSDPIEEPEAPKMLPSVVDDDDVLASVGMFLGDEESEEEPDIELPPELQEPSFAEVRKNKISWVVLAMFVLGSAGYVGWMFLSASEAAETQKEELQALFYGGILDLKTAEQRRLRDKWRIEDTYAKNRYGEFKMMYSPRDAKVTVTQYKYVEPIPGFIDRFVRGGAKGDQRKLLATNKIQRVEELTTSLDTAEVSKEQMVRKRDKQKGERLVISEQNIKNLPLTQRTNPQDKDGVSDDIVLEQVRTLTQQFVCKGAQKNCLITRQPMRISASEPLTLKWTSAGGALLTATTTNGVDLHTGNATIEASEIKQDDRELHVTFAKGSEPQIGSKIYASYQVQPACTFNDDEFCTYVYKLRIERDLYKPKQYVINSDFSLASPGLTVDKDKERAFTFEKKGPSVYEVAWPGVDLEPTPELFQLQYIRLMTTKAGQCNSYWTDEERKQYAELETDAAKYQMLYDNGFLSLGPPFGKAWTMDEFNAQVRNLQSKHSDLWTKALEVIGACKCDKGPNSECWRTFRTEKFGPPPGSEEAPAEPAATP